jgi:predicted MFS family arabinose efflux permease
MKNNNQKKICIQSLIIASFPVIFFAFQFIPRLWLGQIADHAMDQLSINVTQFGYISALYYCGYAGMQIPVAMMLDRFPPRYVISGLIFLLSAAFFIFTLTDNWIVACVARFFIGVGSAGGFLGVSKIISQWFDRKTYAKLIGISISLGIIGAVYGGGPTYILVQKYGVNNVAFGIVAIGMALCLSVALFVRSPKQGEEIVEKLTLAHLRELISSPMIWILGAVNLLLVGPLEGFADVWGERYLMSFFGFEKEHALQIISFIFIGLIAGSPILPWIGRKIGDYALINLCGLGIILSFVLVFSHCMTSYQALALCFFMVGVFSAYQTNLLSAGLELVNPVLMGVAVAFLNSWNMFGGTFFHSIIGKLMNVSDSGGAYEGISEGGNRAAVTAMALPITEETYVTALSTIPIAAGIGIILMCIVAWYHRKNKKGPLPIK